MADTLLSVESGRPTGSSAARRLRAAGRLPAVVYGLGTDPVAVSVDRRALRTALSGPAGLNTVLELDIDGSVTPAIVKEIQRDPVRRSVAHVDFIRIDLDKQITVSVPVRLTGTAAEVAQNNGLVDLAIDSVEVVTTPRSIPDEIAIDVTDMTIDSVIRIGDLTLPTGVEATGDPETPVVTVLMMRTTAEAGEAAEGGAAEEAGEAGEADEAADTGADAEAGGDDTGE